MTDKFKINISEPLQMEPYSGSDMEIDYELIKEVPYENEIEHLHKLEKEIRTLKDISDSLNSMISLDDEKLEEVDNHVDNTIVQVEHGEKDLEKASYYAQLFRSRTARAVGGAVVGGAVFGGVGSLIGGMGILVGSALGLGSGAVVGAITKQ